MYLSIIFVENLVMLFLWFLYKGKKIRVDSLKLKKKLYFRCLRYINNFYCFFFLIILFLNCGDKGELSN